MLVPLTKNARLAIRKCRGAAAGAEIPFSTRLVAVWGKTPTGGFEQADTLVIEWGAETSRSRARPNGGEKPLSKSLIVFLDAVRAAVEKSASIVEGGIRHVSQAAVRGEFYQLYPAKSDRARATRETG